MKTKKNIKGGAVPPPKKIGSKFRFKLPTNYYKDITNDNMDIHIDPEKYDRKDTKDKYGNIFDTSHYVTGTLDDYSKEGYHFTGNMRIPYINKYRNQYNYIVPACGNMEKISDSTVANTVGRSVRNFGKGLIGKGGRKKKTRRRKPKKKRRKSRRILNKRKTNKKKNKSKKHI
tara:strand:- start:157 stop:675 length:519 start_codon:yes stop_codon:yes gene_type:complete